MDEFLGGTSGTNMSTGLSMKLPAKTLKKFANIYNCVISIVLSFLISIHKCAILNVQHESLLVNPKLNTVHKNTVHK